MHYTSSSQARCCQFSLFFLRFFKYFSFSWLSSFSFSLKKHMFFCRCQSRWNHVCKMLGRPWHLTFRPHAGEANGKSGEGGFYWCRGVRLFLWVEDSESPWFLWCFYDGRILGPVGIRCILRSRKFTKVVGWFLRCWMYGFQICAKGVFGTYGSIQIYSTVTCCRSMSSLWLPA